MRKQLILGLVLAASCLLPYRLHAQSTEGTDFWVTLMRGDERKFDELTLTFAAKESTKVYIENEHAGFKDSVTVGNDTIYRYGLNSIVDYCYVTDAQSERPEYRALHVYSIKPISLIAANYKNKSFDVAAILPTTALMSEYRIQCYSPSAHEDNEQGSQFAIIAADDNVVVDYVLSENSSTGKTAGTTYTTDTLKKGQVYYVWSGQNNRRDFTGTSIKARDNKKIAVFNGNSHTNIPNAIRDRDHIYSQAMPVNYWGKRFAITSSLTTIDGQTGYWERIDKIRVQALVDGTVVRIDGDSVYTFDFAKNPKHYYEFDYGAKDIFNSAENTSKSQKAYKGDGHDYYEGASHYIETSCPSAVHIFMTSDRYDHDKVEGSGPGANKNYCNGDPSEIWVNPIEQKIKKLTFSTFQTQQVQDHFINIVTTKDNVKSVLLDGDSIYTKFFELKGDSNYVYARISGVIDGAHTLVSDSGFIAHVYGFGEKESYGYPAGGETKDLTAFITINGTVYKPGEDNLICGKDNKVVFGCELNYEYDSIYWSFGDGLDSISLPGVDSIEHSYAHADVYKPYVLIYRHMGEDDGCVNFDAKDSISFIANIGNFKVDIKGQKMPECAQRGQEVDFLIYLDNPSQVDLTTDSVQLTFNQTALDDGFSNDQISVSGDTMLTVQLPSTARENVEYGLHLHIGSECPNSVLDKDLSFHFAYARALLQQRYSNVLGLVKDSFDNKSLSDFVWYHDGEIIPNQQTSVLYLDETNPDHSGEYKVCYTIHEEGKPDYNDCTCPVTFQPNTLTPNFSSDSILDITATYLVEGKKVFVNANWGGKTDIECYAQWIDVSGNVWGAQKYNIPDGGCTIPVPTEKGFYILRVVTDGAKRSFKFIIH